MSEDQNLYLPNISKIRSIFGLEISISLSEPIAEFLESNSYDKVPSKRGL